ncbi:MAG: DMT family transporter [Geminicoccaceae bacterium]|nr:MAG: DMT family transporter [Geminicoccaceae bacterium]
MRLAKDRLDVFAMLVLCVLCLAWGLNTVAIKVANEGIPPVVQATLRSFLAAVLVGLYARWRGIPLFRRDASTVPGIACGVLFGLEFVAFYVGVDGTTAARAIIFLYTMPFFVALGAAIWLPNERLRPVQVLGLVIAFIGMAFGLADGFQFGGGTLGADLACVLGAVLWAATTMVIRTTALMRESAERILFYQLAYSVPIMALCAPLFGPLGLTEPTPLVWLALAYQVVIVVAVTYLVWFWLITRYPASQLTSFTFLTPLFGVAFGALLLGDPISVLLALSLLGVALGIYLVNRPPKTATAGGRGDARQPSV